MLYGSITADLIDCDVLESGKRRGGAFAACASWIMKFGMGLGSWASGEILERTGFHASPGGNRADHAIFMIRSFWRRFVSSSKRDAEKSATKLHGHIR